MAVKLRLKRMGSKARPFYRIVAADSRSPRDGKFIETVGTYNPIPSEKQVTIDEEKVMKWLGNGAKPTDTVRNLLSENGVWAKFASSKTKAPKKAKKASIKDANEKPAPKKTTAKKTTTKKESK